MSVSTPPTRTALTRPAPLLGAALLLSLAALLFWGRSTPPTASHPGDGPFIDVAAAAGVHFQVGHGEGVLNILDAAGNGSAFLDYNRDGWQDILLVAKDRCSLFHNDGGNSFQEVTGALGLPQHGYWIGCAVADYDNDGYPDIFLNGYGSVCLLHNEHGTRFRDVTAQMGLIPSSSSAKAPLFGVSAAWGDVDRDGWVDLYVGRYLEFGPGSEQLCRDSSGVTQTCRPDTYAPQSGVLYRNVGGKRLVDVTRKMGADCVRGKTWAVLFFDFNNDGWPDLYLANDLEPGNLLQNFGGKRFKDVGKPAGVAFDADGRLHGGMGVDAGDYNGDGRMDLVVTTYLNEPTSLYRNVDNTMFTDVGPSAGIGFPTLAVSGWATKFFDYDNDGWLDLLFVNGHVTNSSVRPHPGVDMAQPPQLFRNQGGTAFAPVSLGAAGAPIVGRGAAFGDFDNDGFPDVLVANMEGRALLLRNTEGDRKPRAHWLGLSLTGRRSNRMGLGARVTLRAGGRTRIAEAQTGGGAFSSNDPRVRFGLGSATTVDEVVVRWPSGATDRLVNVPVDRYVEVTEGQSPIPTH